MGEMLAHDLQENWFALGGDVYVCWGLAGSFDRLLEDVRSLEGPRYETVRSMAPQRDGPSIDEVASAAGNQKAIEAGNYATIWGKNFTANQVSWDLAMAPGSNAPPNALDGVMIRIGGKECSVSWVSPGQVNVLAPADLAEGVHEVEVFTPQGTARATATVRRPGSD